jgi:hypothetical protein
MNVKARARDVAEELEERGISLPDDVLRRASEFVALLAPHIEELWNEVRNAGIPPEAWPLAKLQ